MAHFKGVARLRSLLPFVLLLSTFLFFDVASCYPVPLPTSPTVTSLWPSTDSGSLYVHGVRVTRSTLLGDSEEQIGSSSSKVIRDYSSTIWSKKNKLAIGLGIGLGAIFVATTVTMVVGYQKSWHKRIFSTSRHRTTQANQISRPMFQMPRYSLSGHQRAGPNNDNLEARRMSEGGTSCRSITTPPPVYTSIPDFPNPVEAYYQPVEIYRAIMRSPSPQQYSQCPSQPQPAMPPASLPPAIPPPPPSFPPPDPPQRHELPEPIITSPHPAEIPGAPRIPSASPSYSPSENLPTSPSSSHPEPLLAQPQLSNPPPTPQLEISQFSPPTPSPTLSPSLLHPIPYRISPFLNVDPFPSLHPNPQALRSNSHDTNASTFIDPDAMSERSEPVSPMTVPGAAIRVERIGRGVAPHRPGPEPSRALGLGFQGSQFDAETDDDEGGMAALVGLGISLPPSLGDRSGRPASA